MIQITLEIPDTWADLPERERDLLIRAGLHEAMRARVSQLEAEIAESEEHIRQFETRYGVPFSRFEAEILPDLDNWQAHEDYNDWFFWQSVLAEKQGLLAVLKQVERG
jgi:hypothetical protein